MVIRIFAFMLTALAKCWQINPIIASQHKELCHKITSFPFQKTFLLSITFKMTSQKWLDLQNTDVISNNVDVT